jgi:hypothetical protein
METFGIKVWGDGLSCVPLEEIALNFKNPQDIITDKLL